MQQSPSEGRSFNPFSEKRAGQYFVGREDQLHRFGRSLDGLQERVPQHIFVAGVNGTGKTSFLGRLLEVCTSRRVLGVHLSLDTDHTDHQQVLNICREALRSLDIYNEQHLKVPSRNLYDWDLGSGSTLFEQPRYAVLSSNSLHHDFKRISRLAEDAGLNGVALCIDEGQRIDPAALSAIKNSLQSVERILVILSLRIVVSKPNTVQAGRMILEKKADEAEGDFGASSFYVTGIPMGPFDHDAEVRECIEKRLFGHKVSFDGEVISAIARISRRVPREIIRLSALVYDTAVQLDDCVARPDALQRAFRQSHGPVMATAQQALDSLPETSRQILRSLSKSAAPMGVDKIIESVYPEITSNIRGQLLASLTTELDLLCTRWALCEKHSDGYQVSDPVMAYALELSLDR